MSDREWEFPLYAAMLHDNLRCEVIGGPFFDIDSVIDACWDRALGEELSVERFFVIETGGGRPVIRVFPAGVFPSLKHENFSESCE